MGIVGFWMRGRGGVRCMRSGRRSAARTRRWGPGRGIARMELPDSVQRVPSPMAVRIYGGHLPVNAARRNPSSNDTGGVHPSSSRVLRISTCREPHSR